MTSNSPRLVRLHGSPSILRGSSDTLLDGTKAVQRRSNIKREDWGTVLLGRRRIVVNHIANFLAGSLPFHDPVVPIKRRLGAGFK